MTLLSRKADYALLILSHLHRRPEGATARAIADKFELSRAFVANILKELCNKGFVVSHRGVKGGYSLGRDAAVAVAVAHTLLRERASQTADPFGRRDGWRSHGLTERRFAFEFGAAQVPARLTYQHDGGLHLAVGEGDLDAVLAGMPQTHRERVALLQNELVPESWTRHAIARPTVLALYERPSFSFSAFANSSSVQSGWASTSLSSAFSSSGPIRRARPPAWGFGATSPVSRSRRSQRLTDACPTENCAATS